MSLLAVPVTGIDILAQTYPTNALVETVRWLTIGTGGTLFLWCTIRYLQHERFWSAVSLGAFALLAVLQVLATLGEPYIPWRLILLLLATLAGCRYMYYSVEEIKQGPRR